MVRQIYVRRCALFGVMILLSANFFIKPVSADDFEWTSPVSGFFGNPGNWTQLSGVGSAPPSAADTAIFNEAGGYTATFTSSVGTNGLEVVAGDITFRSLGTDRTYTLFSDALLDGGDLTLGVAGDPLNLNIEEDLRVQGGSLFFALHASEVNVGQLWIGANSSGNGAVIVDGGTLNTAANVATNIGRFGNYGSLALNNAAAASIGGELNIAVSSVNDSSGSVSVDSNSEMRVTGDVNLVTGDDTNQLGFLNVVNNSIFTAEGDLNIGSGIGTSQTAYLSVAGASFMQNGPGTIDVGGAIAVGNFSRLDVTGSGTFSSGTGPITIHPTGNLEVGSNGSFIANGPVTIENTGRFVIEQGNFEATAGFDNSADGTIDIRDGTLTISGGHFEGSPPGTDAFTISGASAGDLAKLIITSGATGNINQRLFLGSGGTAGELEVSDGASLSLDRYSQLGSTVGSLATVTVTDAGRLSSGGTIGNAGTANVEISAGGQMTVSHTSVGGGSTGEGNIEVRDEGSRLHSTSTLTIGDSGVGELRVRLGGEVQARQLQIGTFSTGEGNVSVFSNSTLIVDDDVHVAGFSTVASGAMGRLALPGGYAEIGGMVKIWDTGVVVMNLSTDPFLSADSIDNSTGGTFDFRSGTLEVDSFIGDLVNQGGTLAPGPGASPTAITGDYTQQIDGILDMEIGGTSQGGTHDVVTVTGTANIDGLLEISLINGFVPEPDDEIILLSANSLNGFFDNIFNGQRLDVTGGEGSFVINYGVGSAFPANQIILTEFEPNVVIVEPNSFLVTRGQYVSGDETDLADSDNADLSLRRLGSDIQSRTEFEVKGFSPFATPSSFEFTLEGTVFARSNVVQTIELFDYVAADWELVDTRNAVRSPAPDMVVTVAATGDLSRFVEAGTMCIEARVRYRSDNPRQNFASNTDRTAWTIE